MVTMYEIKKAIENLDKKDKPKVIFCNTVR